MSPVENRFGNRPERSSAAIAAPVPSVKTPVNAAYPGYAAVGSLCWLMATPTTNVVAIITGSLFAGQTRRVRRRDESRSRSGHGGVARGRAGYGRGVRASRL